MDASLFLPDFLDLKGDHYRGIALQTTFMADLEVLLTREARFQTAGVKEKCPRLRN